MKYYIVLILLTLTLILSACAGQRAGEINNFRATEITSNSITLEWDPIENCNSIKLYLINLDLIDDTVPYADHQQKLLAYNAVKYTWDDLDSNTTYRCAIDAINHLPESEGIEVKTLPAE